MFYVLKIYRKKNTMKLAIPMYITNKQNPEKQASINSLK